MKIDRYPSALAALALLLAPSLPTRADSSSLDWLGGQSKLSQESGTISIEDSFRQPLTLRVLEQAPIYYQLDLKRQLGTMPRGSEVTVIALSAKDRYKVRGKAFHGGVSGWMRVQDLAGPDPNFAENLRKLYQRQRTVVALIEQNKVALGMTTDEIIASIGRPTRTSTKIDANGKQAIYEYVTYDRVPQYQTRYDQFGRPFTTTVYIKVETGKLSVTFSENLVASIEETEGNPLGGGGVITIPPPIFFR